MLPGLWLGDWCGRMRSGVVDVWCYAAVERGAYGLAAIALRSNEGPDNMGWSSLWRARVTAPS